MSLLLRKEHSRKKHEMCSDIQVCYAQVADNKETRISQAVDGDRCSCRVTMDYKAL
jgi:hypothetical protein